MKNNGEHSLKSLNMKWLVLLAAADVLFVLLFVAPDLLNGVTLTQIGIGRVLNTTVMPVVVLLFVNVLPHDVKSMLVYWRPLGVLPGCEAFTKYGPRDPRIDMVALKKNVGALPTESIEQNSKWYKLYKQVPNEPEVQEAHKLFLMYRDMVLLSLPLVALVPLSLNMASVSNSTLGPMTIERYVIDTNVLISAALSAHSAPGVVVRRILAQAEVLFSEATFASCRHACGAPSSIAT